MTVFACAQFTTVQKIRDRRESFAKASDHFIRIRTPYDDASAHVLAIVLGCHTKAYRLPEAKRDRKSGARHLRCKRPKMSSAPRHSIPLSEVKMREMTHDDPLCFF